MRTIFFLAAALVLSVDSPASSQEAAATPAGGGTWHPYPLFPSTPIAGWPGVEAAPAPEQAEAEPSGAKVHGQPEFLPYPGSVEHVRGELQRYAPPYPVCNQQTLRRNMVLCETPPYAARCVSWQEPVYFNPSHADRVPTSQHRPVVKAYPWRPAGEPIVLRVGRLPPSLYVIRPIAAAPAQTKVMPKRCVFVQVKINDLPDDPRKMNCYVLRAQALDNFYAIQEFYFHVRDDREHRVEIALLPQSELDLLLYNVDVHDRFGDCAGRRGKRHTTLFDVAERHRLWEENRRKYPREAAAPVRSADEQRAYDDLVWRHLLPPLNAHTAANLGTGRYDRQRFNRERFSFAPPEWAGRAERPGVDAKNDPLGLSRRNPIVFHADEGQKLLIDSHGSLRLGPQKPPAAGATPGQPDTPVELPPGDYYDAAQVTGIYAEVGAAFNPDFVRRRSGLGAWHQLGNRQAARDEAMKLIRFIYDWPAVRPAHNLSYILGQDGLDRRYDRRYQWSPEHGTLLAAYDALFEFIDGNEELAAAVGRYVPWVKTPDDLVRLIDTYLVQDYANDIMKYRCFYDHGQAAMMIDAVLVQDCRDITDPWMDFLWTRGWEYPQALAGIADNAVTSIGRDGATNVGSIFYAIGGQLSTVELIQRYMQHGGNPKYDLTDPLQYPKLRATIDLPVESCPAGRQVLGVGDVGGPSQPVGRLVHLENMRQIFETGWRWTRQPKFAYELINTFGRADETDAEWEQIAAAAGKTRDPYLMNRSRVLSDWGAFLAGGQDEDDFRFKREVTVRIGTGAGHAHDDTLDLRLFAHGLTMSGDLGQRPGYGKPGHALSRMHNVVEVDGRNWMSHAWVRSMLDAPGAPSMTVEAAPAMSGVKLFRRQVALLDVEPGIRSAKSPAAMDPGVTTPSAYVLDVFRVSGGRLHTYCFHGCVDDGFDVNVKDRQLMRGLSKEDEAAAAAGKAVNSDEAYLAGFRWRTQYPDCRPEDKEWAAFAAQDTLVATWRLSRGPAAFNGSPESRMIAGLGGKHGGAMTEPRKFTRLYLFEQTGHRILHGIGIDRTLKTEHNPPIPYYAGRCLFAQNRGPAGQPLESVFVGLIEPYAGEPFITAARTLEVAGGGQGALRTVAVDVTTRNAHRDLCVADGQPGPVRSVAWEPAGPGGAKVAAEFAYLSRDGQGLRQAVLAGGTLLETGEVAISAQRPGYTAKIAAVDYLNRTVRIDGSLPGRRWRGKFFEFGNPEHRTNYEITDVASDGDATRLTLRKGLETMRSHVTAFDADHGIVTTSIAMLKFAGADRGLTASNEQLTRFWRVAYLGGSRNLGHRFQLSGGPWSKEDFGPGTTLRIWEFGAGDTLRIAAGVSVRRLGSPAESISYEVLATTPVTLTLRGTGAAVSPDGKSWQPARATARDRRVSIELGEDLIDRGAVYVRLDRGVKQ